MRSLLLSIFLTIGFCADAQLDQQFEHLSLEDGLQDLNIGCFLQDQDGFIWIGTGNGICRYDGYSFDPIFPSETSLSPGPVSDIIQDQQGYLWITTKGGGVSRIHPRTRTIDRWQTNDGSGLGNNYGSRLRETAKGEILLATDGGIFHSSGTGDSLSWREIKIPGRSRKHVVDAYEDRWGRIWFGTPRAGMGWFQQGDSSYTAISISTDAQFMSDLVYDFFPVEYEAHTDIWVSGFGGINLLQVDETGIRSLTSPISDLPTTSSFPKRPKIFQVFVESESSVWAAGYGDGLMHFNQTESGWQASRLLHSPELPGSLPTNDLYSVMMDRQGILWVGTEGFGISKLPIQFIRQRQTAFNTATLLEAQSEQIDGIYAFLETTEGDRWIGTGGAGLQVFDSSGIFVEKWNEHSSPALQLPHPIVTTILPENDSQLWIGTFGGLALIHTENKSSKHFRQQADHPGLASNHVFALCKTPGTLWVGTRGGGLNRYDVDQDSWQTYQSDPNDSTSFPDNYVWKIISDGDSVLWICTDGGLVRMRLSDESFRVWTHAPNNPEGLSHRFLNAVFLDREERLWVGTAGGGVNLVVGNRHSEELSFQQFRVKDGFPSDYLYDILEDQSGRIWVSTTRGLVSFQAGNSPDSSIYDLQRYDSSDGLQGDEFNAGAFYLSDDGYILAGGLKGYNRFHPDQIPQSAPGYQPVLTRVTVLGDLVPLQSSKKDQLPFLHDQEIPVLSLGPKDYQATIHFSSLNFLTPQKGGYFYQLEDVDPDWVFTTDPFVSYTTLPPGTHRFQVKVGNLQSEAFQRTLLIFKVAPPWWRTIWAMIGWSLLAGGIAVGIARIRIRQKVRKIQTEMAIREARAEERQNIRKETARDFHDELGNHFTRITLFAELISRKTENTEEIIPLTNKLSQNIQDVSRGMRDLIWMMDPDQDTMEGVFDRLVSFGHELFEYSEITFETVRPAFDSFPERGMDAEKRKHLLLLFHEAMNNCLKYSEASTAVFSAQITPDFFQISFSDNGKGFDPSTAETGNGLENMEKRAEEAGGKFTLDGNPGNGVRISVTLPLSDFSLPDSG